MSNFLSHYEVALNSAVEAANAYLDMEGGEFLLAWTGELIQNLIAAGNFEGACLTVQQVCEAVKVDSRWVGQMEYKEDAERVWLASFAEALMDHATMATG